MITSLRKCSPAGILVLAFLAACFGSGTASGQDSKGPLSSWDNLKSLAPGQEVRVIMNNFKSSQGAFESLTDDGITLRQKAGEQTLARKDIFRISEKTGPSYRLQLGVLGAAAGAVGGFFIGHAIDRPNRNCTLGPDFHCSGPANALWRGVLTPLGGLGGAALGAAATKGGWHDLYRAR